MPRESALRLRDAPESRIIPFSHRLDARPSDRQGTEPSSASAPRTEPASPIPGDFVGWDTMIMALMA